MAGDSSPAVSPVAGDLPDAALEPGLPRAQSRWLMRLARVPRRQAMWACAAPLIAGALLIVQAWLLARILDGVVMHDTPLAQWWPSLLGMGVLMLARAALSWLGDRAGARAAEHIKSSLRRILFAQMTQRGPAWSRTRVSGELAAGLLEHVEALDGFFAKYLPALVAATVLPLAFAVAVMPMDVVAGLLLLVTAPLIPMFMALVGWGAQAASRRHLRAMSRLSGFFVDRLRGAFTLKLFGREQAEARSVAVAADGVRMRTLAVLRIAFLSSAVLEFFAALGVAGMAVYFGLSFLGFLDLRGSPLTLQIGMFCLLMAPEAYAPLRQFAAHYHDRATAQAAVSELTRVFQGLPDIETLEAAEQLSKGAGSDRSAASGTMSDQSNGQPLPKTDVVRSAKACALSIRDLRADRPDGSVIFDGLSLVLTPGDHVAVMGESGIGKTTLLDLIARLRQRHHASTDMPTDPASHERIELDGRALDTWEEGVLRDTVGYIGQRPYLFEGSIADNIRLGAVDATDAQLHAAAERACVTAFAAALPGGLDARIGARGHGLSGGQAHRVALARLYLRRPGLILIDEPTAHLDDATAHQVMAGLIDFAQGRSLVVATHSALVSAYCARTYVLGSDGLHTV